MIGDRIRLARRKAGFSLRDLSAAIGGKRHRAGDREVRARRGRAQFRRLDGARRGAERVGCLPARHARHRADRRRVQNEGEHEPRATARMSKPRCSSGSSATSRSSRSSSWTARTGKARSRSRAARDRSQDAEKLANDVREKWKLGVDPIPNMTELLEEKGLKVLVCRSAGARFRIHLPRWPAGRCRQAASHRREQQVFARASAPDARARTGASPHRSGLPLRQGRREGRDRCSAAR